MQEILGLLAFAPLMARQVLAVIAGEAWRDHIIAGAGPGP